MITLDADAWPHWEVTNSNPLTVRPSVDDSHVGGRCHYAVRDGRIRWV